MRAWLLNFSWSSKFSISFGSAKWSKMRASACIAITLSAQLVSAYLVSAYLNANMRGLSDIFAPTPA